MKEFKLIVAGGRDFDNYPLLERTLLDFAEREYTDYGASIVSGMARGADALAVEFAINHEVILYEFPADWARLGKRAGFIRNEQMAQFADGLLAFWDWQSRGTKHMIETMQKMNKPVYVVSY